MPTDLQSELRRAVERTIADLTLLAEIASSQFDLGRTDAYVRAKALVQVHLGSLVQCCPEAAHAACDCGDPDNHALGDLLQPSA